MPRRNASQMRISTAERAALRITRADERERRRTRLAYKANEKAVRSMVSETTR